MCEDAKTNRFIGGAMSGTSATAASYSEQSRAKSIGSIGGGSPIRRNIPEVHQMGERLETLQQEQRRLERAIGFLSNALPVDPNQLIAELANLRELGYQV